MDILYYSNNCKFCKSLLANLAKLGILDKYNFICIDRRSIDPNTRQISIMLDRGVKTTLPPNVSRVPTLLLVNENYKALVGDDIYDYINSQNKPDPNNIATQNGGEPIGYIMSPSSGGVNIVSETYTMYNVPPEELSAKGMGVSRQMHNYASANVATNTINTPLEDSASAKHEMFNKYENGAQPQMYKPTNEIVQVVQNNKIQDVSIRKSDTFNRRDHSTGETVSMHNSNLPNNAVTYNPYSIPGVMYSTGQLIVPELQRPPAHKHMKLGEDVTIDSLQQKRNMELTNSLPFIAKQLSHIISPEISELYPPERQTINVNFNN